MCVGECKHGPKSSTKFKQVSNFDSQQIDTMKSEIQKNNMNVWIILLVIQVTVKIDNIWYSFSLGCSIVVVKSKETKLIFLFRFGTEEECVCVCHWQIATGIAKFSTQFSIRNDFLSVFLYISVFDWWWWCCKRPKAYQEFNLTFLISLHRHTPIHYSFHYR